MTQASDASAQRAAGERSPQAHGGRNAGPARGPRPRALLRFGFRAFVGASFAEIFAGNCTALGLPCVTLAEADLEALMDSVSLDPAQRIVIDLSARTVHSR